jgi:GxxExxY protein
MTENEITGSIVNAAMKIHTALGPGVFENVYKSCLQYELVKRGLRVEREHPVPVQYDGERFDFGYRIDLLVEGMIVVEVKAAKPNPLYEAQLLSYLRLSGLHVGLLLNFHVASMKDGVKRMIN